MTTLASKNPDVFITMTGATQCPQIINEVANNGMKQKTKYQFTSSVCKASSYIGKDKVGGDGSQSNGWYIVGGGFKDFNSRLGGLRPVRRRWAASSSPTTASTTRPPAASARATTSAGSGPRPWPSPASWTAASPAAT